jgi:hypothetical protein
VGTIRLVWSRFTLVGPLGLPLWLPPLCVGAMIAVFAQITRNWLMLHALGIDASIFDSIALLIGMVALSQLPVGPSVGAAAAVLILGTNGVAIAAAAGVLLTATGTVGALGYMTWALGDRLWSMRRAPAFST